jgi:hypothetical protein
MLPAMSRRLACSVPAMHIAMTTDYGLSDGFVAACHG